MLGYFVYSAPGATKICKACPGVCTVQPSVYCVYVHVQRVCLYVQLNCLSIEYVCLTQRCVCVARAAGKYKADEDELYATTCQDCRCVLMKHECGCECSCVHITVNVFKCAHVSVTVCVLMWLCVHVLM